MGGHMIIVPESESIVFERWSILGHELGHVYHDNNRKLMNDIKFSIMEEIGKIGIEERDDENDMRLIWGGMFDL